jgi:hypothetical protein
MTRKSNDAKGGVSIQVNVKLESSPTGEKPPQAFAYAFTDTGHFLSHAAIESSGSAKLTIPSVSSARNVRIVVGPEIEGEKHPALSDLTRRSAQQQFVRVDVGAKVAPVQFEILHQIWPCWFRTCLVEGNLLKRIYTGGLPVDLPVCGAQVQIWEVEPIEIILEKVPISVIERLRQIVINPPPNEVAGPFPVNPNPPDPPPFQSALASAMKVSVAKPLPTLSPAPAADLVNLQVLAQTATTDVFRQGLISNVDIIRYWFCEYFPLFVTKTLIGTVTTDHCGHFSDRIFLGCFGSNPNFYFTASWNFLWIPITIYGPTLVACYTYWNYSCGTDVTLYVTSCFAPCCSPCPPVNAEPNYVLFRAIGATPLSQIRGDSNVLPFTSSNIGLAAGVVKSGEDSPFGELLLPAVEFDSTLLENGLAAYYKISYQAPGSSIWNDLIGDIFRHYNQFVGTQLVTSPYSLGPQTVGTTTNLFAIPPALPPAGDWAIADPVGDVANGQFPTSTIAPNSNALYKLKLDLYNSAGNPVNITTAGIKYYVPTGVESDGTIDTVDASTIGLVSGNSLIISVYVDNRPTVAQLPGVSTPVDSTATDPCGILHYNNPGDNVDIQYVAYQPENFLDWDLNVTRGISGIVASLSGNSSAGVPSPGVPDDFNNTAGSLMGTCAQAAFAVNLNSYSRATNGWSRLSDYDDNDTIAFALNKPCPPCPPHRPQG